MDDWLKGWNASTVCNPGEAWGNCFMRLTFEGTGSGGGGGDCTSIATGAGCAPLPRAGGVVQGPAEILYGAYAVWFVNEYITRIYAFVQSISPSGDIDVTNVVNMFNSGANNAPWPQDTTGQSTAQRFGKLLDDTSHGAGQALGGYASHSGATQLKFMLQRVLSDFGTGEFLYLAQGGGLLRPAV
ncbi:MAG: hypothetical protein Q9220_005552 [cf. Caloplaca sp. 1 TL-2023]